MKVIIPAYQQGGRGGGRRRREEGDDGVDMEEMSLYKNESKVKKERERLQPSLITANET